MAGFEIVDELDVIKPGRPIGKRGAELESILTEAQDRGAFGIKVELDEDEKEKFYRFLQRTRSAAKRLGMRVNVSVVPGDPEHGHVRILEG